MQDIFPVIVSAFIIGFGAVLIYYYSRKPSHARTWNRDQVILPAISTYGPLVTIHNIRNIRYQSEDEYDVNYYDKTFKLSDVVAAWFIIEPFGPKLPFGLQAAHTFISFELRSSEFISISVEIRKKKNDTFSSIGALKGLFRTFEIMYVIADERDVIQLRTTHRKDVVRLYPLNLTSTAVQDIFVSFALEINQLYQSAAFFHTLFENCTTVALRHMRRGGATLPAWHISYLFPENLDALLYSHSLIATSLPLEEARERFFITEKAQQCGDTDEFSACIRS